MKFIILIVGLMLTPLSHYSQFTWQELESNNQETVGVLHVKPSGEILGYLNHPSQLVISYDKGISWEVVSEDAKLKELLDAFNIIVHVDREGAYYFGLGDEIYKLDISSGSLDDWLTITFGNSFRLEDFAFLPDGNFIVADSRDILLFDMEGNLIKSREWWTHSVQFLVGDDMTHYVVQSLGATKYMGMFSSDLTEIPEDPINQIPGGYNDILLYEEGRLYSNGAFSDDGINWTSYPSNLNGLVTFLSDGTLHLIDGDEIYLSMDKGETFEFIDKIDVTFYSTYYSSSKPFDDGGLVVFESKDCDSYEIFLFEEGQAEMIGVDIAVGNCVNDRVEAYWENNIFTGCDAILEFIYPGSQTWQEFSIDPLNFGCSFPDNLISTPNGNIITNGGCVSMDQGQTWSNDQASINFIGDAIYLTNEVIYIVDFQQTFLSADQGVSWTTIEHIDGANIYDPPLTISSRGFMYTPDFLSENIFKRTLDGDVVNGVPLPVPNATWGDFKASYQGPNVYGICEQWNGPSIFVYSYDDGVTFNNYTLDFEQEEYMHLETDHLGNVYIFTDAGLWISQDEGQNWQDITPALSEYYQITDLDIGWDNHIYLSTNGTGILRSQEALKDPLLVEVLVFEDLNDNCVFDDGELGLENIRLNIGDNVIKNTDDEGMVSSVLVAGIYDVVPYLRSDLYRTCSDSYQLNLEDQSLDLKIPVKIIQDCASLSIGASTPFLRRCFDNIYYIEIFNEGTADATNVEIVLKLDEFFDYLTSDMELISSVDNTYTFAIDDLAPRERKRYELEINLSCESEFGQAHYLEALLNYNIPCDVGARFTTEFECRENIGSYDPNDKTIFVEGFASKEIIGEEDRIEYLIRFQNTGTDTAFTVRIEDELHESFDRNQLYPLTASHDYTWDLRGNKLNILFENILLVDSTANEQASHGFINFDIGLKDDRPEPGSLIKNEADIYFDFNDPIRTNRVETYYLCKDSEVEIQSTICPGESFIWDANDQEYTEAGLYTELLESFYGCDSTVILNLEVLENSDPECLSATDDLISEKELFLFPNPTKDAIKIAYDHSIMPVSYIIRDLSSKLIKSDIINKESSIDLTELEAGLYLISLTLMDSRQVHRKFIVVE